MMTSAAFADSLIPETWLAHGKVAVLVLLLDVGLTSSIAASFMFNGLGKSL